MSFPASPEGSFTPESRTPAEMTVHEMVTEAEALRRQLKPVLTSTVDLDRIDKNEELQEQCRENIEHALTELRGLYAAFLSAEKPIVELRAARAKRETLSIKLQKARERLQTLEKKYGDKKPASAKQEIERTNQHISEWLQETQKVQGKIETLSQTEAALAEKNKIVMESLAAVSQCYRSAVEKLMKQAANEQPEVQKLKRPKKKRPIEHRIPELREHQEIDLLDEIDKTRLPRQVIPLRNSEPENSSSRESRVHILSTPIFVQENAAYPTGVIPDEHHMRALRQQYIDPFIAKQGARGRLRMFIEQNRAADSIERTLNEQSRETVIRSISRKIQKDMGTLPLTKEMENALRVAVIDADLKALRALQENEGNIRERILMPRNAAGEYHERWKSVVKELTLHPIGEGDVRCSMSDKQGRADAILRASIGLAVKARAVLQQYRELLLEATALLVAEGGGNEPISLKHMEPALQDGHTAFVTNYSNAWIDGNLPGVRAMCTQSLEEMEWLLALMKHELGHMENAANSLRMKACSAQNILSMEAALVHIRARMGRDD